MEQEQQASVVAEGAVEVDAEEAEVAVDSAPVAVAVDLETGAGLETAVDLAMAEGRVAALGREMAAPAAVEMHPAARTQPGAA